ncbi:MAG TPA: hypothetical protein VFN13_00435 [Rudaea sp.]|nr:hypothetical protein [Rudaea sp.]
MINRLIFVGLLFSGAALAQQVDISGKDFQSGAGDAKLAQIAQQAAAQNKVLTVTAPAYWQDRIAAKLHAGAANIQIRQNAGFFENVLVRVDDAKSAPKSESAKAKASTAQSPAEEAARVAAAKASAMRAEAEKEQADREAAAQAEAARAQAAKEQAARDEAARIAAQKAEAQREQAARIAAAKAAQEKAAADKAAAAKVAADKIAALRQGMEHNLNEDRPADGTLTPDQLAPGDQLFVDGSVRGVVRRVGVRTQLYWLEGDLNLDRIELQPTGEGRYKIIRAISDSENPVLRTRTGGHLIATVPAPSSPSRQSFQQNYAEGRDITETMQPSSLRSGDIVYTGDSAAVVVRRSGARLLRFWLVGELDLGQTGMIKQGSNAYRILSDTVK